jgi:hypothetical protein
MTRAGRLGGFVLLAGLGLGLLAATVLLPAWSRLAWVRYDRDCLQANVQDERAAAATLDRLVAAADRDITLNRRLAMCELGLLPVGEVVVFDPNLPPAVAPGSILPHRHPRPTPPSAALTHVARRLGHGPTRRGMLLMAFAAIAGACLLFGPPKRAPQTAC